MLSWMGDNQASNEDGAYEFLMTHEDLWTRWVPVEVAEKVKAAL
jgi:glycine betaine/proline transport system substrate-binding protein